MTDTAGDRLRQFVDAQMVIKAVPTLADLSRRSGVSYDTIQKMLSVGRPPKRATLTKIADVLGVTYRDLYNAREGIVAGPDSDTTVSSVPAVLLDAISELVEVLRSSRLERADHEARLRAAEAELQLLREQRAAGVSPTRSAPPVKAG